MNEPGALLFSPPIQDIMVTKYHLCKGCFEKVLEMILVIYHHVYITRYT